MRKLILFGAATTMLLAGAVVWTTSSHSAIEPLIEAPQIDPLSMRPRVRHGAEPSRSTKKSKNAFTFGA